MSISDGTDNLLPRRYQEEVFERAQKENIIAALHTGSGKTFISLLLIRWTAAQEASKGKAIIFLVPKVTLVEQQGNFIAKYTPLRVTKLHGALDINLADRPSWRKVFERNDVFVMTAQIFLNLLTHSLWRIDRVSLMVFDECHHARKNHPYNGILREYFQVTPSSRRPRIFGMSASPIWNPKDVAGSLASLEANMDAKVIGIRAHVAELEEHSPKPVEVVKEYPPPPETYEYPSPSLHDCLCVFHRSVWTILDISWDTIEMRYLFTFGNLGPYAASLFLYMEMQHAFNGSMNKYKSSAKEMDLGNAAIDAPGSSEAPPEISEIRDILSGYEDFFTSPSDPTTIPIPIPLEWCSPKIKTLVDVLLAYHTPTFQGIVFVEQRHVAACLSQILPCIPQLKELIQCAYLVGQGVNSKGVSKDLAIAGHNDAVKLFRDGKINLLIATSVAEEGLDFPACDLVVRFDPLQHMVGYVQSRGRARDKASTFIVMIQSDDTAQLARYNNLREKEPELHQAYQSRHDADEDTGDDLDLDDEEAYAADLVERERYVVPSTGAILTYDTSIGLLNHLCALIPRDAFTSVHLPKYTGDFEAVLHIPPSVPLPAEHLVYVGPPRRSKKEAKRAVAFMAVKRLHELAAFDDYLLPVSSSQSKCSEDTDGQVAIDVNKIPNMMDVTVKDPWAMGSKLWIHPIYIDGHRVAGLVTGTNLPSVDVLCGASRVSTGGGELIVFTEDEEEHERNAMEEYTRLGIWYRISARPITSPLSLFLVPLAHNSNQPDFKAIERLLDNPYGSHDWSKVGEKNIGRLLVMNVNEFGRVLLFRRVRSDLSPVSTPFPGSREEGLGTYRDYFVHKWTRKRGAPRVPLEGPLVEAWLLPRFTDGKYPLKPGNGEPGITATVANGCLVPQGCCRWISMSPDLCRAFEVLPALSHRVTDVYRARCVRVGLGLPPITDDLLVEAFTIPSASAGFSNQRLETLGDAVLQLCTTVHLMNKYPHRHEGQLTVLRKDVVSNRYLLARAKDICLEQYLNSETQQVHKWRYTLAAGAPNGVCGAGERSASRKFARRSLQDCMEATLGASFIAGGIPMALCAGEALGLDFGTRLPWCLRYRQNTHPTSASTLFAGLQESLGYTFRHNHLLLEAVTHPSFASTSDGGPSYQRLEFLGDAILDLVVIHYLYDKFPQATSDQLAMPRTRAICAAALAWVAVRRLGLHKIMLANSVDLNMAINQYAPVLEAISGEDIVKRGWRYDPPKALSDVFESVVGAVLVDSGYDYERAAVVVEFVMEEVLSVLSPSLRRDPVSELLEWATGSGCTRVKFKRMQTHRGGIEREGVAVLVHDVVVVGPVVAVSITVAKFAASERAWAVLRDPDADKSLSQLCDCGKAMEVDVTRTVETDPAAEGGELEELVEELGEDVSETLAAGLDS